MRFRTRFVCSVVLMLLIGFLLPGTSYAYLDPGTGSYVLQLLLATIVGILFAIRLFWGRIKSFLKRLAGKQVSEDSDEKDPR
jgi:hypothetical protein